MGRMSLRGPCRRQQKSRSMRFGFFFHRMVERNPQYANRSLGSNWGRAELGGLAARAENSASQRRLRREVFRGAGQSAGQSVWEGNRFPCGWAAWAGRACSRRRRGASTPRGRWAYAQGRLRVCRCAGVSAWSCQLEGITGVPPKRQTGGQCPSETCCCIAAWRRLRAESYLLNQMTLRYC